MEKKKTDLNKVYSEDGFYSTENICTLQCSKIKPVITVQFVFCMNFVTDPQLAKYIHLWYKQFKEAKYLCKYKNPDQPSTSNEQMERISPAFQRSTHKSTCCAKKKFAIPYMIM
ncbi:hypothetical protein NPIL_301151 [Nephila pilipes]|uniref:Uncharacterized protein n=1 Tax=Nephila pilipes TaxID=299642 RepID=A0A8X6NYI1_NEPPI|nr:hypothetical protein NPIL_301151 [Nephila pilipes]